MQLDQLSSGNTHRASEAGERLRGESLEVGEGVAFAQLKMGHVTKTEQKRRRGLTDTAGRAGLHRACGSGQEDASCPVCDRSSQWEKRYEKVCISKARSGCQARDGWGDLEGQ